MNKRNVRAYSLIASFLLLAMSFAMPGYSATEKAPSDITLEGKVKTALIEDKETKGWQINVEVHEGEVQLSGFVDTPEQKAAASRVASNVAGVRNLKNNLSVQPHDRSAGVVIDDSLITAKVKAALIADSRTKAHQIEVNTSQGVVQLAGFVDNVSAKSAATEVAQSVNGVKGVQNRLEVKG